MRLPLLKARRKESGLAQEPCSLVLFSAKAGKPVGNEELQLISSLDDLLALLRANVMCDLHGVLLIVHQQHLQVSRTMHQKLVEAVLRAKARLLARTVANARHERAAFEFSAHAAIDTAWLTPGLTHFLEAICLEAWEFLHALLHHLGLDC